ncbi:streptophobe family protein [Streptomyces sp. CC219B]|uniref:streptophobe family protein n=1 Tax=Streptomyces sp. CC219B TaxID=3044574 RepID=UPI0024A958D6|nr:streptophobe family protein [Streptomyces sp. CC219B]
MSASKNVGAADRGTKVPWGDVLLSAVVAVSWALIGMVGTAALGLHLLEADTAGSLGPMTAAVVALAAGGSVTPSGDVSAFGLTGAEAATAIEITPLGVSLVGALLLAWFFLRSLKSAGVVVAPAELLARAGAVVALFVAMLGGLAWAGNDVITIDGGSLGLDDLPGGGGGGGGIEIPGLGDVGDIGGLLPDRIGELIDAEAAVGFTVDTAPTLLGGMGWSAGILLIALLASRRTPLPPGWEAVHRVVRPAASALATVLLTAVAAGLAAAAYAAIGDDHPKRIAGAALLGAPNGVWLGIPVGLFVPWDGEATGPLARFLPHPVDDLLVNSDDALTLGRLAELDSRVWLLGIAAAMTMLLAGVLTAVRTPGGGAGGTGSAGDAGARGSGAVGFAGQCALRLGVATALTLPLLAWLTEVSVDASLSVLGIDAFGAGVELQGRLGMALLLGALWGAGAGAAGALLARATGAAGRRATPLALSALSALGAEAAAGDTGLAGAGYQQQGGAGAPGQTGTGYGQGAGTGDPGQTRTGYGQRAGTGAPGRDDVGSAGLAGAGYAGQAGTGYPGQAGAEYEGWAGAGDPQQPGAEYQQTDAGHPQQAGTGHPWQAGTGDTGRADAGHPRQGGAGYWQQADAGHPQQPRPGRPGPTGAENPGQPGTGYAGPADTKDPEQPGTGNQERADTGHPQQPRPGRPASAGAAGPYAAGAPSYRPPNPATNPYLRVPDELRQPGEPEDARPWDAGPPPDGGREPGAARPPEDARPPGYAQAPDTAPPTGGGRSSHAVPPAGRAQPPDHPRPPGEVGGRDDDGDQGDEVGPDDLYGAPTVVRPIEPPARSPRRGARKPGERGEGPPPPPPQPPPPPPRGPKGRG